MSEVSGLERGYRRLLAWYPDSFRGEQEDEMLAVLMAGARPGQRRPRLPETADLLWSALKMRAGRAGRPGPLNLSWAQALAAFGVIAPLFLVLVAVLEVAVPYHLPAAGPHAAPFTRLWLGRHPEIGGLSLLGSTFFDGAIAIQITVAALMLLGRRLALAGMAGSVIYWLAYWAEGGHGISDVSDALQLLTASGYLVGGAALLMSPDARQGWRQLNWRHTAMLLPAAALVQVTTFMLDLQNSPMVFILARRPDIMGYQALSAVLAAATVALAMILRLSWRFLLLLAILFYPYAMELAFSPSSPALGNGTDLLGLPTTAHLAVLFAPPIFFACGVMLTAASARRSSVTTPGDRRV
jgi:hypothetical protein